MTHSALDADLPDCCEDQILGRDAVAELAFIADPHRLGAPLHERLRRENVLNFACSNAECECPEGPVRGCVTVAANDRHPWLREAEFWPDHVDDSLIFRAERVDRNSELSTVRL